MSTPRNVAVFVGSLRKESFSRKLAKALIAMAPPTLKLEIVEIGNLPLYNQDDDANPPAASAAFKQQVQKAEAVLFITPEYNRSVPGVLKNAIDIASRPYGHSAWSGKPGAVISNSPGAIGGLVPTCSAPVARFPERPGHAATRGLHRWCRQNVRRQGHPHRRDDARVPAEVPRGLRTMD
jgi:NAD(P)H-dependent FMN reductase